METIIDGSTLREIISTPHFTLQLNGNLKPLDWKDMYQVLQLHQILQHLFQWSKEKKRFNLASHWEELGACFQKVCLRDTLQRSYGNHQRMESQQAVQAPGGKNQKISGQESPFFRIPGTLQENTRIKGKEEDFFQPKAERVRPNDIEFFGLGEGSKKDQEIVLNTSNRIRSPATRNITPTQVEHSFITPDSNINRKEMWLEMSQFAEKTEETFSKLQENNVSKASEETNKTLNQVLEEQHDCKRDRELLDQDIKKLFNFCQTIKPQPQRNALDNPYHQEDSKPDPLLDNKARSLSQ
ncbi:hypothetical protein O181_044144 [Austropuccinia psidii MF-1]|uniref:Uncharacterized protein n=1 Tax=Austropuccinia psidii MF-1 TaxID=1389203 RepID=A0A9Q3HJ48_9BASI|nr:hypothetical protein [Austropuccinia psidii MF-1]